MDPLGIDEEFDMEDIENDIELQNELKLLGWSDDKPPYLSGAERKPRIKINEEKKSDSTKRNEADERLVEFAFDNMDLTDDNNIEFSDEDMTDPYLLSQLKSLNPGLVEESGCVANNSNQKVHDEADSSPTSDRVLTKEITGFSASKPSIPVIAGINTISADDARAHAVSFHKEGNKAEALKWLKISKSIDNQAMTSGSEAEHPSDGSMIAHMKSTSPDTAATLVDRIKVPQNVPASQASASQGDRFSHLENALNSAMRENLKDAKLLLTSDRRNSANKLRDYKRYQEDLNVLASRRNLPGAEPAPFIWKDVVKETIVERLDVGDDQLVLIIDGISDLEASLYGHSSRNIQLTYDLGVPRDAPATGKITCKVDSHGHASVNHQVVLPIIKRGRSLQTLFSKKKAVFEISLIRGLFYSNVVLGTANLPLADLNTKCECGGILPFEKSVSNTSGGGKKICTSPAGSITAYLRVRKPISGAEIVKTIERVLVLEAWPSVSHVYAMAPLNVAASSVKPVITGKSQESQRLQTVKGSATVKITANLQGQGAADGLSDRERLDPCAVDFLVSNDVLEAEIAADAAAILKIEGRGGASLEEEETSLFSLKMRVQLMSTKLQLLVSSVQEEKLTFEDYLASVTDRLARDRLLLKWLMAASHDEVPPEENALHLTAVARRIRTMEGEITLALESVS